MARPSWRARLADHLESRDVARVVYGSIIGLALVLALEAHPPTAAQTVGLILGTAVAVGLAELYSEVLATETRTRQPAGKARVRTLAGEALAVIFGAAFPAVYFLLAAFDVIGLDSAYSLAMWTGLGLICAYGYAAARLSGSGTGKALLHAAGVGLIAGALIAFKALLH
jgi:hypothetical protein